MELRSKRGVSNEEMLGFDQVKKQVQSRIVLLWR